MCKFSDTAMSNICKIPRAAVRAAAGSPHVEKKIAHINKNKRKHKNEHQELLDNIQY